MSLTWWFSLRSFHDKICVLTCLIHFMFLFSKKRIILIHPPPLDSKRIVISSTFAYVSIFCCVKGIRIWGPWNLESLLVRSKGQESWSFPTHAQDWKAQQLCLVPSNHFQAFWVGDCHTFLQLIELSRLMALSFEWSFALAEGEWLGFLLFGWFTGRLFEGGWSFWFVAGGLGLRSYFLCSLA